jgi:hypothetical protein
VRLTGAKNDRVSYSYGLKSADDRGAPVSIAQRYTSEITKRYDYLATWYPGTEIGPGTVGRFLKDRLFNPESTLEKLGISVTMLEGRSNTEWSHQSATGFEYGIKLQGEASVLAPNIPINEAGIGMRFSGSGATFFQLAGVTVHRIEDQISLAREMACRAKAKQWERDWIVVTEVLRAKRAVILVCQSNHGSAEFSLGADVGVAGLKALTANANVSFTHDEELATKVFGDRLTPLFRAVRLRRKFFVGPREVAPAFAVDLEELASGDEPDPNQILEDVQDYEDEDAG